MLDLDCIDFPECAVALPGNTGYFYLMLIAPDLSSRRVKLGFARCAEKRRKSFSTLSPTVQIVKVWPCERDREHELIRVATVGCDRISREVFDVDSVEAVVARIDACLLSGQPDGFVSRSTKMKYVKLPSDVVRMARIIAAYRNQRFDDIIVSLARPVLENRMRECNLPMFND